MLTACSPKEDPIQIEGDFSKYSSKALNLAGDKDRLAAIAGLRIEKAERGEFDQNAPEPESDRAQYLLERFSADDPALLPQLAILASALDDPDYNIFICVADILSTYSENQISAATGPTGRAKYGFGNLSSDKRGKQMEAWNSSQRYKTALDAALPGLSQTLRVIGSSQNTRPVMKVWHKERATLCYNTDD